MTVAVEVRHFHMFGAIGGGADGFNQGEARVGNLEARPRCIGSVDIDAAANRDFFKRIGVRATTLDMFDREQYIAFWGKEPPPGWREATPQDIHAAAGNERPHVVFLSAPCLPATGLVLTETGPRAISTIRAGDRVLTHKGRMQAVTHVGTHRYTGTMHGLRLNGTVDRQWFTDEHPIWVRPVVRNAATGGKRALGAASFLPAQKVKVGDRVGFPIQPQRVGTAADFVARFGDPQLARRGGHEIAPGRSHAKAEHVAVLDRVVDLAQHATDASLWFLLGAYLGDGYRRSDGPYEVAFCVGPDDGECARQVRAALDIIGVSHSTDRDGGAKNVKVRARGKHFHTICGAFGDGAAAKSLPPALFALEDHLVAALVDGYFETDGSAQGRRLMPRGNALQARSKIASVSLQLLRDFQLLLLRQGIFASVHECWPGGPQVIMGRQVQTRQRWELNWRMDPIKRTVFEFADGAVWVRVRSIEKRATDEPVWNLSVDVDDTYCAPLVATHNCKGFSGLLSETRSLTAKYQALNRLTLRGVWLMLEAWKNDPPEFVLFENVPRIANRGRWLLDQIVALLRAYGYAVTEGSHDCGELGGLSQSRKRFLLIARHMEKVPPFLYQPERKPLQAVGAVLGRMLMPGDLRAGPMHRIPSLQWKTWVRLAFVEAGSDWRSLNKLAVEDGHLRDYLLVPDMHHGAYGVQPWGTPSGVMRGASRPANGRFAVADPRAFSSREGTGFLGVRDWLASTGAVTANGRPGAGAFSVADPRVPQNASWHRGQHYGVHQWGESCGAIAGQQGPNQGRFSVADPRLAQNDFHGFRIVDWDGCAGVVTGARAPGSSAQAVADPRLALKHNNCFKVVRYDQSAGTLTAGAGPSAGGQAVADPRPGWNRHGNNLTVARFDQTSRTVIAGGKGVQGGWLSVADPRPTRPGKLFTKYPVTSWDGNSGTVIGGDDAGAYAVADPRSGLTRGKGDHYLTGGHYGVLPWHDYAGAVSSSARYDNGRWSVADPRMPAPTDKMIAVIRSIDGTWHRPFTTLELAALQSLVDPEEVLELDGLSDSAWRERIGNAVPPKAARAIASEIYRTFLLAISGETFLLSSTPIWVRQIAVGLSVSHAGAQP